MTNDVGMLVREPALRARLALLARVCRVSCDCHVFRCVLKARTGNISTCIISRCTVSLPMPKRRKNGLPDSTFFSEPSTRIGQQRQLRSIRFRSDLRKHSKKVYTAPLQVILHLRSVFRRDNRLIHFHASRLLRS